MTNPYLLRVKTNALIQEAFILRAEHAKALRLAKRLEKSKRDKAAEGHFAKACAIQSNIAKVLRPQIRATLLARGFLKGHKYSTLEPIRYTRPDWALIERLAVQNSGISAVDVRQNLERWKQEGDAASPLFLAKSPESRAHVKKVMEASKKPVQQKKPNFRGHVAQNQTAVVRAPYRPKSVWDKFCDWFNDVPVT